MPPPGPGAALAWRARLAWAGAEVSEAGGLHHRQSREEMGSELRLPETIQLHR